MSEYDSGADSREVFGGDVGYDVLVRGEEDVVRLLRALGGEVQQDLVGLLDDSGLRKLAAALTTRFGTDITVMEQYRAWLSGHGIAYTESVD